MLCCAVLARAARVVACGAVGVPQVVGERISGAMLSRRVVRQALVSSRWSQAAWGPVAVRPCSSCHGTRAWVVAEGWCVATAWRCAAHHAQGACVGVTGPGLRPYG